MKYIKYLIEKDIIDINKLVSTNKILLPISISIATPVAITGIIFYIGALPFMAICDSTRYARYFYHIADRKIHKYKYYNNINFILKLLFDIKYKIQLSRTGFLYIDNLMMQSLHISPKQYILKGYYDLKNNF